jgi:hypothetical protein
MDKRRIPASTRILISAALLSALLIIGVAAKSHAAPYPSLKNAPLETLLQAAESCPPNKKAVYDIIVHPPAFHIWPGQKIQVRWKINSQDGKRWIFPVYLRKVGTDIGEEVPPIWMLSIDSAELASGLVTYNLLTYCGVEKFDLALSPKPTILTAPRSAIRGGSIQITGEHFNTWDPHLLREVRIIEQGGERSLEIEEWSDTKIVATLPEDAYPGKQKLYIVSGRTKRRFRRSVEIPMAVVDREAFPILTITALLEKVFYKMDIHLNNYGPQKSGSRLIEQDAYIKFGEERDAEKTYLNILEYDLSYGEEKTEKEAPGGRYYINDINMDYVKVFSKEDGWSMTLYFEKMHDELIGVDPENLDIRAYVSVAERPPAVQLDNLSVVVDFDLTAEDGIMRVSPKNITSSGDIGGSNTNCQFKSMEICTQLKEVFDRELLKQLTEKLNAALNLASTRNFIGEATDPWLEDYSMGEVIDVKRVGDEVIIDYLPR